MSAHSYPCPNCHAQPGEDCGPTPGPGIHAGRGANQSIAEHPEWADRDWMRRPPGGWPQVGRRRPGEVLAAQDVLF